MPCPTCGTEWKACEDIHDQFGALVFICGKCGTVHVDKFSQSGDKTFVPELAKQALKKINVVDQITRPRRSSGVDWGKPILVLARKGNIELWKIQAVTTYRAITPDYSPPRLSLVADAEKHYRHYEPKLEKTIDLKDKSITNSLFLDNAVAVAIDRFFQAPIAHLLNTKKTVVIGMS